MKAPDPAGTPERSARLTSDDPLAGLAPWLADARVDEAARSRAHRHWLRRQAEEEATFGGILRDLADRAGPVAISTAGGARLSGAVSAVGADFCAVRLARSGHALIPFHSVATIRTPPGDRAVVGDRHPTYTVTLLVSLAELVADRPRVLIRVGSDEVRGQLHSVGHDVVTVRSDGDPGGSVHVAMGSIDHISVVER